MDKKRFLLIGFCVLFIAAAGIYFARDTSQVLLNLNAKSDVGLASAQAAIVPPPPACTFDTNEKPSHNKVLISEVGWMGTKESANDEWIKLKNISPGEMNITGWTLLDQNEKIKIHLRTAALAKDGAYILSRGASMVGKAKADMLYKGAMRNTGDSLRLFDQDCHLQDEVTAESKWPAGDNKTKKPMLRNLKTLVWYTAH